RGYFQTGHDPSPTQMGWAVPIRLEPTRTCRRRVRTPPAGISRHGLAGIFHLANHAGGNPAGRRQVILQPLTPFGLLASPPGTLACTMTANAEDQTRCSLPAAKFCFLRCPK